MSAAGLRSGAAATAHVDVVYFSSVDWGYTWQRPQQLAVRLARHGRLLYVDPLGLRAPRLGDWRRLATRLLRTAGAAGERPPASLTVHRPLAYWPSADGLAARRWNSSRLCRLAEAWRRRHGVEAPVLWVGMPAPAVWDAVQRLLAGWPRARLVYDCLDDVAAFHGGRPFIRDTEDALAARADVVWAASRALLARMQRRHPRACLLPNAAEVGHFRAAVDRELPIPDDLAAAAAPRIVYVGELAPWIDFDLLRAVAHAHPRASLVLIGPVHDPRARDLARMPNVHVLGARPYAALPAYLRHAAVCLLPFADTPLTRAANPIKVFEYLAAGRPVVSTPLPEVRPHAAVVTIAERGVFPAAVGRALSAHAAPGAGREARRRLEHASRHDWDDRVAQVLSALSAG